MLLSVIIPTCHRNELLSLCLDALKPGVQALSNEYYEVIVTDDGAKSTAEELIKTKYPWVKWVQGPRKGPAANRNFGAKNAENDWLVFVDDDCLPDTNLLVAYKGVIAELKQQIFEGRIYTDRVRKYDDEDAPVNETGGYLWSCNFCIQRNCFFEIDGFDENFPMPAMEDVDFHYRVKKAGYIPQFVYGASVMHPWRRVVFTFKNQLKREASTKMYLIKHPEERKRIGLKFHLDILRKCTKQLFDTIIKLEFEFVRMHFIRIIYAVRMSIWLLLNK